MSEFFYNLLHLYDSETYQTFEFTPNTLRIIFIFAWIGIIMALIGSFYSNHYLGGFVEKLVRAGADSPENAKSLAQLKLENKAMLSRSLREGSVLRKYVQVAKIDSSNIDISNKDSMAEKYFIESEKQVIAQKRFRSKGNGIVTLVASAIIITLVLFLALIFGPWLFGIADGMLAAMR